MEKKNPQKNPSGRAESEPTNLTQLHQFFQRKWAKIPGNEHEKKKSCSLQSNSVQPLMNGT